MLPLSVLPVVIEVQKKLPLNKEEKHSPLSLVMKKFNDNTETSIPIYPQKPPVY